jgi:hypothetical protein
VQRVVEDHERLDATVPGDIERSPAARAIQVLVLG